MWSDEAAGLSLASLVLQSPPTPFFPMANSTNQPQEPSRQQSDLPWIEAIEKILIESPEPYLHYTVIADRIISGGLRKNLGATPRQTVNSLLNQSPKFKKVSIGIFALASKPENTIQEDEEDSVPIISSFGMFWRREEVQWVTPNNLQLLGVQEKSMQGKDLQEVNFSEQIGLYLLYDRREVIYVGRAKDSTIGKRLCDHLKDRLADRWDGFSWFGFLPVKDTGELGTLQTNYDSHRMISDIEAILIEALEPRQNRRRGDNLEAVEYLQVTRTDQSSL